MEKTAESLIQEFPDQNYRQPITTLEWLQRAGWIVWMSSIALIALSIIYLLVTVYIPGTIRDGSVVGLMFTGAVFLLLVSVIFALPYFYAKRFHRSQKDRQDREPASLPQPEAATLRLSESHFVPVQSITERTTASIAAEPKARRDED